MNNTQFKKLQDRWYQKLKNSGFEDIEYGLDSPAFTKNWKPADLPISPADYQQNWKFRYFRAAGQYLWENLELYFSRNHFNILLDHCAGLSLQKIKDKYKLSSIKKVRIIVEPFQIAVANYIKEEEKAQIDIVDDLTNLIEDS